MESGRKTCATPKLNGITPSKIYNWILHGVGVSVKGGVKSREEKVGKWVRKELGWSSMGVEMGEGR